MTGPDKQAAFHQAVLDQRSFYDDLRDGFSVDAVVVDISPESVRTHASEAAYDRLEGEIAAGGLWQRVWRGNVARGYYLTKYTRTAEQEIIEQNNLVYHLSGLHADPERYRQPLAERYARLGRLALRPELGESYQASSITGVSKGVSTEGPAEANPALTQAVRELIATYVESNMAADEFDAMKQAMFEQLEEQRALRSRSVRADNLFDIAQAYKRAAQLGEVATDALESKVGVVSGTAHAGIVGEQIGRGDRALRRLANAPFVNEATVAIAASAVYSAVGWSAKTAIGATAAWAVAPGAAAGLWAGLREKAMADEERNITMRRAARGEADDADQERFHIYQLQSARMLYDQLRAVRQADEAERSRVDYLDTALQAIAKTEAKQQLRLIDYADLGPDDLALELGYAKLAVHRAVSRLPGDRFDDCSLLSTARDRASGAAPAERSGHLFDTYYSQTVATLGDHVHDQDKAYRRQRAKWVGAAALKGTGIGMGIGLLAQEGVGLLPGKQGLLDWLAGWDKNASQQTLVAGMLSDQAAAAPEGAVPTERIALSDQQFLQVPETWSAKRDGAVVTLFDDEEAMVGEVRLGPDGTPLPDSLSRLAAESGLRVEADTTTIPGETPTPQTVDARTFMAGNSAEEIKIGGWYDNNTSRPDRNELGLRYVSSGNDGPIVVNISNLTGSGSRADGLSLNWRRALADGRLKLFLSASADTKSQAIALPINSNGTVNISDNPAASQLFTIENGRPVFQGRFMQLAEVVDGRDGSTTVIRPLSTVSGAGKNSFMEIVTPKPPVTVTTYNISDSSAAAGDSPVGIPPVIPLYPRRPRTTTAAPAAA